ncbi:ADP-ribosyltransferase [Ligilactobacillus ruminis]|uniref:ADP-ribosyltransferase n=1 Tax=Ligilactobacillus ruminis TaxID=1623 RepID=UPI0015F31267
MRNADNIKAAISKLRLKDDIIIYRNDKLPQELNQRLNKFLSTSAMPKAAIGKVPNVAIIVPRVSNGGYVELIADEAYRKRREFLINSGANLELVKKEAGLYIYKLR